MRRLPLIAPLALALLSACGGESSPDTEPPQVVLTSPAPGVVSGSVQLVAQADDNVAVARVLFLVNGVAIGAPVTSPPFQTTWETGSIANGVYTLTANAADAAGNGAVSPGVQVTVTNAGSLRITTASDGFDVDPDGYRLLVDGTDFGAVGSAASATVSVPAGPHSVSLGGVAGNCALHLPRARAVTIAIGTETGLDFAISCSLASGPTAERILFSRPDLTPLGNGPEQLHAVNADGTDHVQITDDQYNYVGMVWSPDRATILFASDRLGLSTYSLYLMDPDGGNIRPVNESIRVGSASWSPDATRIVYHDFTGIQIINRDGTGNVRLTADPTDAEPAWSPDGGRMAFSRNSRLYVMNADGSDVHPISDGVGGEGGARWSPDGTRILYVGNRLTGLEVYVIQDDGTGRRNVTSNQLLNDSDPSWSPTGDRIVYTSSEFPDPILYQVPADGSGPRVPILTGAARFSAWR